MKTQFAYRGRHAATVCLLLIGASLFGVPVVVPATAQLFPNPSAAQTACWTQTCGPQMCSPSDYPSAAAVAQCVKNCRAHSCGIVQTVIFPKYLVMTLIYAPPGCGSGTSRCAPSSVDYANGSSTGTKMTIQESFKMGTSSGFSMSVGYKNFVKFGATDNDQFTQSGSVIDSETISKSHSSELKQSGDQDGIDHRQDRFVILLNPAIAISKVTDSIAAGQTFWNIGANGPSAQYYDVTVDMLQHPDDPKIMSAQTKALLTKHGLTTNDFNEILKVDPFASGPSAVDPKRFVLTSQTVPYDKPSQDCGGGPCACLIRTIGLKNDHVRDHTVQSGVEINQTFTSTAGATLPVASFGFTSSDSLTISSSTTVTNTTDNSNSASYTINCPSADYSGPTQVAVYWDTVFGTFMFAPLAPDANFALLHAGVVVGKSGTGLANEPLTLVVGGVTLHTWSNQNGSYRFPNVADIKVATGDLGKVRVGGKVKTVRIGDPTQARLTVQ